MVDRLDERSLSHLATEALSKSTGLSIDSLEHEADFDTGVDGRVSISRDGRRHSWAFLAKTRMRPGLVPLIIDQRDRAGLDEPLVLFTEHVSPGVAARLKEAGIAFADTSGNAYLDTPDWLVQVIGNGQKHRVGREPGLGPAVWKVCYVLLQDPQSARLSLRELGALAGVSHGSVRTAMMALESRGWLRRLGSAGAVITDHDALHRAWEVGYLDRLGPSQLVGRATPLAGIDLTRWAADSSVDGVGLVGGEIAAEVQRLGIVASTGTVHVEQWGGEEMRALGLVPAEHGPIRVIRTFGSANEDPDRPGFADLLLIRAELVSIQDERLSEVRARLLERIRDRWSR